MARKAKGTLEQDFQGSPEQALPISRLNWTRSRMDSGKAQLCSLSPKSWRPRAASLSRNTSTIFRRQILIRQTVIPLHRRIREHGWRRADTGNKGFLPVRNAMGPVAQE
jgi:hypothetical protein